MTPLTRDYPYLYLGSLREAKQYGEAPRWMESHKQNVACKEAIEEAIRNGFDGMHLDRDCAKGVIDDYGFKRVGWVLANTIQLKSDDGRFSLYNKEWAGRTFIPPSDRNHDFVVGSHPAVLDGFVNEFREALAELQMFNYAHCDSLTGEELTGRVLVMNPSTLKESYWAPENQLWYATGGFGCTLPPLAVPCTPPALEMAKRPDGIVQISLASSKTNTCPTGPGSRWRNFNPVRRSPQSLLPLNR